VSGNPDPAAIRYEVLSRMLTGREGWSNAGGSWRFGDCELVPKPSPGLSYELWRNKRCIGALLVPKDAVAVAECLVAAARAVPSTPERLFRSMSIPTPNGSA
jgi:hypothetical protein